MAKAAPQVGIVSLGCPKALVDSERILTKLRADGYTISGTYNGADVVIVNTCGFLESAKIESLEAIGEALDENGRVIVTGCLGADESTIRDVHPDVLSVSGPHQYETVVAAVHEAAPPVTDPFQDVVPPEGIRLTPRHMSARLGLSEGGTNAIRIQSVLIIKTGQVPAFAKPVDAQWSVAMPMHPRHP